MISIIICSRKPDIPKTLKQNINQSIGCEYELIIIDNSSNKYSIFAAYNEGASRAKGEYLCFMHEDILFITENWGTIVTKYLSNSKIGLIGVAGGQMLPKYPAGWSSCGAQIGSIVQGYMNYDGKYATVYDNWWENEDQEYADAVSVDGVWMCVRKEIMEETRFDEITYTGFHAYDLDICLQILSKGYRIGVVRVLIEHKSLGRADESYAKNLKVFYNKWKDSLPIVKGREMSLREQEERQRMAGWYWEQYNSYLYLLHRFSMMNNSLCGRFYRFFRKFNPMRKKCQF